MQRSPNGRGRLLPGMAADNVTVVTGPLAAGHAEAAPYDVILLEARSRSCRTRFLPSSARAAAWSRSRASGNAGVARLYLKSGGIVTGRRAFNAAVKPLPGFERTPAFVF